ncbi:MAG: DUF2971 domain-containing protein [Acidobacteriaceae bacterium]|nr:DUF2971 domain-containing protein [Acidobacteriaceae bacterium]
MLRLVAVRVYKYLLTKWAISNIEKQHVKASDPDALNDPFEFLPVDVTDDNYRKQIEERVQFVLHEKVLCCFSQTATDPLLWAHYGDCHSGICLGLEISEMIDDRLTPVNYVNRRYQPTEIANNQDIAKKLLFTKFSAWGYEREVRALLPKEVSEQPRELTFITFDEDFALKEAILGHKCRTCTSGINSKLADYPGKVKLLRAHPSLSDFTMSTQTAAESIPA